MEVNTFQILLIDVTFFLKMFKTWYAMKNEKYIGHRRLKG